jgi:hypothetical protein
MKATSFISMAFVFIVSLFSYDGLTQKVMYGGERPIYIAYNYNITPAELAELNGGLIFEDRDSIIVPKWQKNPPDWRLLFEANANAYNLIQAYQAQHYPQYGFNAVLGAQWRRWQLLAGGVMEEKRRGYYDDAIIWGVRSLVGWQSDSWQSRLGVDIMATSPSNYLIWSENQLDKADWSAGIDAVLEESNSRAEAYFDLKFQRLEFWDICPAVGSWVRYEDFDADKMTSGGLALSLIGNGVEIKSRIGWTSEKKPIIGFNLRMKNKRR